MSVEACVVGRYRIALMRLVRQAMFNPRYESRPTLKISRCA